MTGEAVRWSEQNIIKCLQTLKQLECLWNTDLLEYKNSAMRQEAYRTLVNEIDMEGLTVAHVEAKIKDIRWTYCRLLRLQQDNKTNPSNVFWFSVADSFLRDVTLKYMSSKIEEEAKKRERGVLQRTLEPQNDASAPAASSSKIINYLLNDPASTPSGAFIANQAAPARADNITTASAADEFDHFARSIAIQMRRLPELDALDLMQEMQVMVIRKRRQLMREQALSQAPGTLDMAMSTTSEDSLNSEENIIVDPLSEDVLYAVKQEPI